MSDNKIDPFATLGLLFAVFGAFGWCALPKPVSKDRSWLRRAAGFLYRVTLFGLAGVGVWYLVTFLIG